MRLLLIIFLSLSAHAKSYQKADFNNLMKNYLQALKNGDKEKLKTVTTQKFYHQFNKTGLLEKVLKLQKKGKVKPFDLVFKKGSLSKDLYLINIKDKTQKNFGENWYYVREKEGKLLLDEMHSLK